MVTLFPVGSGTNLAMASPVDILQPHLASHDVLGSVGCGLPSPRCNLLVEMTDRMFDDNHLKFRINQYSPEGFGIGCFNRDFLSIPGDEVLNEDILLLWDVQLGIPPLFEKIWMFNVIEEDLGIFHFDSLSSWQLVDKSPCRCRPLHVLELFGGGMGGWKAAGSFLTEFFQQKWMTIAMEQQLEVAMCYAITHGVGLLTSPTNLPCDFFSKHCFDWMICADICDKSWQPTIANWGVDAILLSPPCQPWSTAANSPGLERFDGQLTALGLLQCRWYRPHFVALEQVVGFQSHPHKPMVIRILHWLGYRILFEKVVDLADQSPSHRKRFLLVAIRVHSQISTSPPKGWFRQDFHTQPLKCCIRLSPEVVQQLTPDERVVTLASSPEYVKGSKTQQSQQILASRVYQDGQCLPTFMARYGSQHEIDEEFLKCHGYLGHFVATDTTDPPFRFWHPAEIAIVHGIVQKTFLPGALQLAWHIVGNQICLPHALIVVADLFTRLHHFDFSPFVVFSKFQAVRFQGSNACLVSIQGGFLIDTSEDANCNQHVLDLIHKVEKGECFQCWLPNHGFNLPHAEVDSFDTCEDVEVISQGIISPTMPFVISVLACFKGAHSFKFWCDSSISCHNLEALWCHKVRCSLHTSLEPGSPCIMIEPSEQVTPSSEPWDVVVIYTSGELTLWSIHTDTPLLEHDKLRAIGVSLFDQFGAISSCQKTRFDLAILTTPVVVEPCKSEVIALFAAFRIATLSLHWDPDLHDSLLLIECLAPGVSVLLDFWTSLFSSSQLENLGYCCYKEVEVGGIRFVPLEAVAVVPPAAFHLTLGMAAVRSIFSLLPVDSPVFVRLTWFSRPLWAGHLSADCSIQLILNVLGMGMGTVLKIESFSLVHLGRRAAHYTVLSQLADPAKDELVLHVVPCLVGGGPSKQQQKSLAKNSIAAVLLEHGLELGWVKNTVEALQDQCGIPKLQQILIGPTHSQKLQDIKQACIDIGIRFPTPAVPTNQANTLGPAKNKRRKETATHINPADYKVDPGFFQSEDGSPAQLSQLRANASGFCLVSANEATPWLRANQAISADELGVIVLGKLQVETSLTNEPVTMPCTDHSGQAVLLSGTLIQLGGKTLTFAKGDPKQVDAVAGHLMSVTLFKDDWGPERWIEATANPLSFITKMLEQDNLKDCVQAMWGRSLRAGRAQATPAQATSVQIHCTVVDSKRDKILQASGLNSLFFTPKTRDGRVDESFKIVWIDGDLAQATGLTTQTPHCLGLVKGRTSYGLRFPESKFVEAWSKIHPGQTPPLRSSGNLTFKIEGLPFGCTGDMLTKWGDKIKWTIVPFKALGPSAWLVKSDQQVPPGLLHFNTTPVLVRFLPPKDVDKTPMLVGPRPKHSGSIRDTPPQMVGDPWANYTGPRLQPSTASPLPARTLEGPVASKLKEQDEKIATLQSDLKKLAIQSDKQFGAVETRMDAADKQQAAQFGKMEASMKAFTSNIDNALKSSVQQNASLMEQKMNELKALFQTKRPREDDPME